MTARSRVIACVVLLAVVLVPLAGLAGDDLSPRAGTKHHASLRPQPQRGWRTLPAAVELASFTIEAVRLGRLEPAEPTLALPVLVRIPFVPPRG